jgi:hypothetical protein
MRELKFTNFDELRAWAVLHLTDMARKFETDMLVQAQEDAGPDGLDMEDIERVVDAERASIEERADQFVADVRALMVKGGLKAGHGEHPRPSSGGAECQH